MYFKWILGLFSITNLPQPVDRLVQYITANRELLTPYLLLSCIQTDIRNHPDMKCYKIICDIPHS